MVSSPSNPMDNANVRSNHRHHLQVKQAERLDQKVREEQGSGRDDAQTSIIFHSQISPVESTHLQQRKTEHRNGRTLKMALVAGRYNEQETIRKLLREGLPKKQMPLGKPGDMLT